ncbi:uncharacterized protein ACNS7B_004336 [Menidia menidia]
MSRPDGRRGAELHEYGLVALWNSSGSYRDLEGQPHHDDFDVSLVVCHQAAPFEEQTDTERHLLRLQFYLILTSQRELFPRLTADMRRFKKLPPICRDPPEAGRGGAGEGPGQGPPPLEEDRPPLEDTGPPPEESQDQWEEPGMEPLEPRMEASPGPPRPPGAPPPLGAPPRAGAGGGGGGGAGGGGGGGGGAGPLPQGHPVAAAAAGGGPPLSGQAQPPRAAGAAGGRLQPIGGGRGPPAGLLPDPGPVLVPESGQSPADPLPPELPTLRGRSRPVPGRPEPEVYRLFRSGFPGPAGGKDESEGGVPGGAAPPPRRPGAAPPPQLVSMYHHLESVINTACFNLWTGLL